jgi:hypothetical protein
MSDNIKMRVLFILFILVGCIFSEGNFARFPLGWDRSPLRTQPLFYGEMIDTSRVLAYRLSLETSYRAYSDYKSVKTGEVSRIATMFSYQQALSEHSEISAAIPLIFVDVDGQSYRGVDDAFIWTNFQAKGGCLWLLGLAGGSACLMFFRG